MRANSSTQRIVLRSRNSSVQGMMRDAMIPDTVSAASSMRAKEASMVRRVAGRGMSRRSISVTTPRSPSEPMKTSFIEKPATSLTQPEPKRATVPSMSTTWRAMT